LRIDVSPQKVWIDIDQPQFDTALQPPSIIFYLTFNQTFTDRLTKFLVELELKYLKLRLGLLELQVILDPKTKAERRKAIFSLTPNMLQLIEKERQESQKEDLVLTLRISGKVYYQRTSGDFQDSKTITKTESTFTISISKWKKVLGLGNYQLTLLPTDLIEKLENLRKNGAFGRLKMSS